MTRRRLATTGAAILAATASLTACSDDGPEIGDVFQAHPAAVTPLEGEVRLPVGVLHLSATNELTTVPATDAVGLDDDLRATDDLSYIGVAWKRGPERTVPVAAGSLVAGATPEATVALVDGDLRIELGPVRGSGAVFAAVPADLPEEGHLEVSFDGVIQEVSMHDLTVHPGDAAALYADAPAKQREQDCAATRFDPGVSVDHLCGALLVPLPYVPEAGWAAPGTRWAAVRLETSVSDATVGKPRDAATYTPTDAHVTATLAGQPPLASLAGTVGSVPGDSADWFVFPMPDGAAELAVTGRYAFERVSHSKAQPATKEITTSSVVTLTP